jgi:ketosteroid isomerase-like protein
MSSNVDVLQGAFDALSRDGVDAMLLHVHPDFEMSTPSQLASEPDTYRGPEGVRRWFDEFYEAMDEVRLEIHEMVPVDHRVAVALRIVARGRNTSLETSQEAQAVCSVEGGKLSRIDFAATWEDALAARTL